MSPRRVASAALALAAGLLAAELLSGYLLWRVTSDQGALRHLVDEVRSGLAARRDAPDGPPVTVTYQPGPMFGPDPELGFVTLPGTYQVRITDNPTGRHHDFRVTVDPQGHRVTSPTPEAFARHPEVWILGDSFVFGWGNNDDTTLPWFLQRYLPDRRVVNLGSVGYGNLQEWLLFARKLATSTRPPEAVVVAYADYFNERNVAAPNRLAAFRMNSLEGGHAAWSPGDSAAFTHPRARLMDDRLVVDRVPLFPAGAPTPEDPSTTSAAIDAAPSLREQHAVTCRILEEILTLGRRHGCRMLLGYLRGATDDPVVGFAGERGYEVVDLRPVVTAAEWDDFRPFDAHPGPRAQAAYAFKLYQALSRPTVEPRLTP